MIGVIGVSLAGVFYAADIEAELPKLFLEEMRVLPELLDALRFLLQHIERRDTSRCH